MKKITFVPVGGLANRLRAMASAVVLAEMTDCELDLYWFQDWALNAPFRSLFDPVNRKGIRMHESSPWNLLLYDRPRKRNVWIPRFFQKCLFKTTLYEKEMYTLKLNVPFFTDLAKKGGLYIASYHAVVPYSNEQLQALFRPVPEIRQMIEKRQQGMSDYRIGVHVRRTDNVDSIQYSPDELFYQALEQELSVHPELSIYLATDSEEVKRNFRQRYGEKVFYSQVEADRNSIAGIQEAIVEMFVLAGTQKIYGSYGSSYSDLAAQFGSTQLIKLKKED